MEASPPGKTEYLFDVSDPAQPRELTSATPTLVDQGITVDYWSWYYSDFTRGWSFYMPRAAKFAGTHLVRAAGSVFDVHAWSRPDAGTPSSDAGSPGSDAGPAVPADAGPIQPVDAGPVAPADAGASPEVPGDGPPSPVIGGCPGCTSGVGELLPLLLVISARRRTGPAAPGPG